VATQPTRWATTSTGSSSPADNRRNNRATPRIPENVVPHIKPPAALPPLAGPTHFGILRTTKGPARPQVLAMAQWRIEIARISAAVASTALVVGYAVGSGRWVATGDVWYRSLEQPPWQPPSAVFGIIWPYNFAALIAAGIAVALSGSPAARTVWLVGLALSVAAALAWARLLFAGHSLWPAAVALIASAVLTVPIVVAAWNARTWAGAILLPYNVWVALAASVSVGYALRN